MEITKCDKCGAESKNYQIKLVLQSNSILERYQHDLCYKCYRELKIILFPDFFDECEKKLRKLIGEKIKNDNRRFY